jgi:L-aspartate oxidase
MTAVASSQLSVDLVVVGTGVAGLTAALRAAELGLRVVTVTKAATEDGNTWWAQGGVAVVLPGAQGSPQDSIEAHVADTLAAGAGLCDEVATRRILAAGPAAVAALRRRGAVFDGRADDLERTREGGHRAFRVIHAGGDATGSEIERTLASTARGAGIPLVERQTVTDVLCDETGRVAGVALLGGGRRSMLHARAVLLATGGLGRLFAVSTNPEVATGDGLALALRAGAVAADLEFVQFHPTVLHTGPDARGRRPLVTEAVRGEGAVLLDITGWPVMSGVHPLRDLAPRDVVAAAITRRMAATGADHVLLDATHLGGAQFRRRFPTVYAACAAAGIDPGREPIPVSPAAHYQCGGVVTDTTGRTTVSGLYAAGEVARTGLHGANRLASNSLLEGLVMGARAAEAVSADLAAAGLPGPPLPTAEVRPVADRDAVARAMSAYAGIGRDAAGLAAASAVVSATTGRCLRTAADAEAAGLTLVAAMLLAAATARTETRGCHLRTDYPGTAPEWRRSITVTLHDSGLPVAAEPVRVGGAA